MCQRERSFGLRADGRLGNQNGQATCGCRLGWLFQCPPERAGTDRHFHAFRAVNALGEARLPGPHRPERDRLLVWITGTEFKTDVSLKTFFGRGSGESIQMEFNGDGFVVIQPSEEHAMQHPPA